MAPAILPDSISTTAAPSRAITEEFSLPYEGDVLGSFSVEIHDGMAAPAPTTSAALFKIVLRSMSAPSPDGVSDPLFFFIIRLIKIGLVPSTACLYSARSYILIHGNKISYFMQFTRL